MNTLYKLLCLCLLSLSILGCGGTNSQTPPKPAVQSENRMTEWVKQEQMKFDAKKKRVMTNPFSQPVTSVRELKVDVMRYVDKTVVVGPLLVAANYLEHKQLGTYVVVPDDKFYMMDTDFDAPIDISYKRLQSSNINPVELKMGDIIYVKGIVEIERGTNFTPGIAGREIICVVNGSYGK